MSTFNGCNDPLLATRMRRKRIASVSVVFAIMASSPTKGDTCLPTPETPRTVFAIDKSAKLVEAVTERVFRVYTGPDSGSERLLWQANLVNSPAQIFVAPGGETVVTIDRSCSSGWDPLVFYGDHGRFLKRYDKAEGILITAAESPKVTRSVSSFWWNRDGHAQFTGSGAYFWVWLPWSRVLIFDSKTGDVVDADSLRVDFTRGRPEMLKTAEIMAESEIPSHRVAAARLAGWLNGQAALPVLRKLLVDPYHEDTGQQTRAEDPWGRFAASSPFLLLRRVYPVRRAAAEELHIQFGQAQGAIEELIAY
jgi:hypothetical protein